MITAMSLCGGTEKKDRARGCVFLPTFNDTEVLAENYAGQHEISSFIDIHVFDDNFENKQKRAIRQLCDEHGWYYQSTGRGPHGGILDDYADLSAWNLICWQAMTSLAARYEYVVKLDTDACIVSPAWYEEFDTVLVNKRAYSGTAEYRPWHEAREFWELAASYGYRYEVGEHMMHLQGGIAAYSKQALMQFCEVGFFNGPHRFSEDFYFSYLCQILGIQFFEATSVGSWWHPYRPRLDDLQRLRAIHPLRRGEWEAFQYKLRVPIAQ